MLSTDLPMQNEVRVMLNPYDNDSRCIPPSFITKLSLTPRHLMFCNESDVDGMAMQLGRLTALCPLWGVLYQNGYKGAA